MATIIVMVTLFIDRKDTKFQSNSQRPVICFGIDEGCLSTAKIQNFKAIHNSNERSLILASVVYRPQRYKISKQFTTRPQFFQYLAKLFIDRKDTKFQSNSQLIITGFLLPPSCLSTAKIQNFKAIHNKELRLLNFKGVVYRPQRYKICKQKRSTD